MKHFMQYLKEAEEKNVSKIDLKKYTQSLVSDISHIRGFIVSTPVYTEIESYKATFKLTDDGKWNNVSYKLNNLNQMSDEILHAMIDKCKNTTKSIAAILGVKSSPKEVSRISYEGNNISLGYDYPEFKLANGIKVKLFSGYSLKQGVTHYVTLIGGNIKLDQDNSFMPEFKVGTILVHIASATMDLPEFYKIIQRSGREIWFQSLTQKKSGSLYGTTVPTNNFMNGSQPIKTVLKASGAKNGISYKGDLYYIWDGHPVKYNDVN